MSIVWHCLTMSSLSSWKLIDTKEEKNAKCCFCHQDVDVVGSPSCHHDMTEKLFWQSQISICHVVQNGFPLNFILIVEFNFTVINFCMNYNMSYFIIIQCQVRPCHKKIVGQFTIDIFLMNFAFP